MTPPVPCSEKALTLSLYYYDSCPYCRMLNYEIAELSDRLPDIEKRNIQHERQHYEDLIGGGGKRTVPCLLIEQVGSESYWMYETRDIIAYLHTL